MGNHDAASSRRRITVADVARALGVAPATVSNAYNRPDQLSPALRERILATAAQMGYHPNPAARGLRRGRSGAIGVLYANRLSYAFIDPAYMQFLRGVAVVAEAAGLSLTLFPGAPRELRDPEIIRAAVVDGFVLYSMPDDDPLVQAALERRLPLVCVDAPVLAQAPVVGIDDAGAAYTAAAYLLALGHRRLGVLALPVEAITPAGRADEGWQARVPYRIVRERLRGYAAACAAAGVPWSAVPVEACAENTEAEGGAAAARLLASAPECSAILAMSDRLALGALHAVTAWGLAVPRDLSLVGFDDIPDAAQASPPLTTVQQPHEEKGRRAAELLVALLQDGPIPTRELLATRLVLRGSTAQPGG